MDDVSEGEMMTTNEAAALLGMTRQGVRALIVRGALPARRIGARLYVLRRAEVEAYRQTRVGKPKRGRPSRRPQPPAEGER